MERLLPNADEVWMDRLLLVLSASSFIAITFMIGFWLLPAEGAEPLRRQPLERNDRIPSPGRPAMPPATAAAPAPAAPTPAVTPRGAGETYVAGFIGPTWPSSGGIELFDDPAVLMPGTTQTDVSLKNSIAYGAKVGHYFNGLSWLGLEMEVFNTTAHEKQQRVTRFEPGFPPASAVVSGVTMRVLTLAWNVVARYPGERFQPYAGIGIGAFLAHRRDAQSGESASSTVPGLNAEAGLRYKITDWLGAFGEWKFNHARFNFDPTPTALFGQRMTYDNNMLLFGVFLSLR
jgi:opacity protein-like surface antigen